MSSYIATQFNEEDSAVSVLKVPDIPPGGSWSQIRLEMEAMWYPSDGEQFSLKENMWPYQLVVLLLFS